MKKYLLSCFVILYFGVSYSQKYRPVDSTTIWNTANYWRVGSNTCCYVHENASFFFKGYDSNNGNTWLRLYKTNLITPDPCYFQCTPNSPPPPPAYGSAFVGYVMNDSLNKRVYFTTTITANYTPTANKIYYDFLNKNVGDSLTWGNTIVNPGVPPKFKILAIDSFSFAGKYHKRFKAISTNNTFTMPRTVYVIEGVGSTLGAWNSIFTDFEANSSLTCFSKPSNAVSVSNYTTFSAASNANCAIISSVPELKQTLFSIYPNPVHNSITINNANTSSVTIYDMFGKVVMEQNDVQGSVNVQSLPVGVYLLNVRSANKTYTSKFVKE